MSLPRSSLPQTARDRLIFALDVDTFDEAVPLVKLLANDVGMFKVGPRLFAQAGTRAIEMIHSEGSSVFLDLKFHDIPETVGSATKEMVHQGIRLFTVHALGGPTMLQRASHELSVATVVPGAPFPTCLAVTVLTSHGQADVDAIGLGAPIPDVVTRLAKMALASGVGGIVSSGHELSRLVPLGSENTIFVTPGIRGAGDAVQDQTRIMAAGEAIRLGATYLVVGRPIRQSSSPAEAAKRIVGEIGVALSSGRRP